MADQRFVARSERDAIVLKAAGLACDHAADVSVDELHEHQTTAVWESLDVATSSRKLRRRRVTAEDE